MNKNIMLLIAVIGLSACVTINIYFPAAAAEKAADKIIEEVWQLKDGEAKPDETKPGETKPAEPKTGEPASKDKVPDSAPQVKPADTPTK